MSSFDARLRLPGQTRIPLKVVVDITDEAIAFSTGDQELGDWPIEEVDVESKADGFHLKRDKEEIVLSVTEPARFAGALGIGAPAHQASAHSNGNGGSPNGHNATSGNNGISGRLDTISPEEQFDDIRRRISVLKTALTDNSISPRDVFARWLRLLKEINVRHGQGAMPTPLFYRFNTEILDLIPVPQNLPDPSIGEWQRVPGAARRVS